MRLTLAASVASDIKQLKASLKGLAERLGHPSCATGCNSLYLNLERDFVARVERDAISLNPQPLPPVSLGLPQVGLPQDPIPWKPVNVSVSAAVFNNIDSLNTAVEKVLGRLGCPACCSGFDIIFQREADGFAVNAKLDVTPLGRYSK
jgi:hypothetical protein